MSEDISSIDEELSDEEFYDEEIAPALLELAKKCQDRKLPFFALVGYDREESSFGYTKVFDNEAWSDPHTLYLVNLCLSTRNIEQIGLNFTSYLRKKRLPHSSCVLSLLGLEPEVEKRED